MVEEREIVGIFIPFAAGVACCTLIPLHYMVYPASAAALAFIAWGIIHIFRSRNGNIVQFGSIFFILGALSWWTNELPTAETNEKSGFETFTGWCATSLKDIIDSVPYKDKQSGALVQALTTGDKGKLSKETILAFRKSGAAHILALSGLHLGIIYLILLWMTAFLGHTKRAKWIRYFSIVGLSGFYCLVTGAAASIIRAFLFIFLNETSKITGHRKRPIIVLFGALTIQLTLCPDVITSPGFQLSYMAMMGIYLLFPALDSWYPKPDLRLTGLKGLIIRNDPMRKIWSMASLSIACQIFTAPIAWYHFNTFPKYFLITNLIALPLTSIIMISSIAVMILTACGICPLLLVEINEKAIGLMTYCLGIIADM